MMISKNYNKINDATKCNVCRYDEFHIIFKVLNIQAIISECGIEELLHHRTEGT